MTSELSHAVGRTQVIDRTPDPQGRFLVWLFVFSTFFPYAAIGYGASSYVPISSVLALLYIPLTWRTRQFRILFFLAATPLLQSAALVAFGAEDTSLKGAFTWTLKLLPLLAFAAIANRDSRDLIRPIIASILGTSLLVAWQMISLPRGVVPLRWIYDLPGPGSTARLYGGQWVPPTRAFGQFPEPSFMAGTLAIAALMLIIVSIATSGGISTPVSLTSLVAVLCIVVSGSGSAVATAGVLIFVVAASPRAVHDNPQECESDTNLNLTAAFSGRALSTSLSATRFALFLAPAIGGATWAATKVLSFRQDRGGQNFSWSNRFLTIEESLEYFFSHISAVVFGIGHGSLNELVKNGVIVFATRGEVATDVASVIVRFIVESGVILTLAWLAILLLPAARNVFEITGWLVGAGWLLTFVIVAGLTITFDHAAWIWGAIGIAFGIQFSTEVQAKQAAFNAPVGHARRS